MPTDARAKPRHPWARAWILLQKPYRNPFLSRQDFTETENHKVKVLIQYFKRKKVSSKVTFFKNQK